MKRHRAESSRRGDLLWAIGVGALGAAFCVGVFGTLILRPSRIDWLMHGDRAQSFLGWLFLANEQASLPLGALSNLLHPIGASLAYTDSAPIYALMMSPLRPYLPAPGQISGLWLVSCYALQAMFGFLLMRTKGLDRVNAGLGALLLTASPALLAREGHFSLCAHWLILASFLCYFRTSGAGVQLRHLARWCALVAVASGVHPYLAVMVYALSLAGAVEAGRRAPDGTSVRTFFVYATAMTATLGLGWILFGYLGGPESEEAGFTHYSGNLLALIDPGTQSTLLPDLPNAPGQYEGFAFLGIGTLALLLGLASWRAARSARRRGATSWHDAPIPLIAVCLALAFFALSSSVRLGSWELVDLSPLYAPLGMITGAFRAPGRFLWPLQYLILLATVVAVFRVVTRKGVTSAILSAALLLQGADSLAYYRKQDVVFMALQNPWNPLRSRWWRRLPGGVREIRLVPPYIHDADCLEHRYPPYFYIPFAYLAGSTGRRINSAHLSRQPVEEIRALCRDLQDEITERAWDPATLYVVSPEYLRAFDADSEGIECHEVDGFHVCAVPELELFTKPGS